MARRREPGGPASGTSVDLACHPIPFHGDEALVQHPYVAQRSRRHQGRLALLAQDAATRVFCYATGPLRKAEHKDELLQLVASWEPRTGQVPAERIVDSRLTTSSTRKRLNQSGIDCIPLRRRSQKMLATLAAMPASAWRRVELQNVARVARRPRVLDEHGELTGYDAPMRHLSVADLGPEEPTLLLTHQLRRAAATLIER